MTNVLHSNPSLPLNAKNFLLRVNAMTLKGTLRVASFYLSHVREGSTGLVLASVCRTQDKKPGFCGMIREGVPSSMSLRGKQMAGGWDTPRVWLPYQRQAGGSSSSLASTDTRSYEPLDISPTHHRAARCHAGQTDLSSIGEYQCRWQKFWVSFLEWRDIMLVRDIRP